MYYPVGWPKSIAISLSNRYSSLIHHDSSQNNSKENILIISFNNEKNLIFILTDISLRIRFCKPPVEIVVHTRNEASIENFGYNLSAKWRPDSTMIVVQTTQDFLLFYKIGVKDSDDELFKQIDSNVSSLKRESAELFTQEKIPSLLLVLAFSKKINHGISRIMSAEEEVVIGTKNSEIIGVNWNGFFDFNFQFKINELLPFTSNETDYYLVDIQYSSMIGGFSLVFANGKAGFMALQSHTDPETSELRYCPSKIQFVPEANNCVATAINHKYQLLTFGLKNSEGLLCCFDDINACLVTNHRLVLSPSSFPNASSTVGALNCLEWSPDSNVIATSWEKGGFALWSVFGALLASSLSWDYGLLDNSQLNFRKYTSLTWGSEGFQLWMTVQNKDEKICKSVNQLSIAKSMLSSNPSTMCCSGEDVLLVSEDRLYLGVGATTSHYQLDGFNDTDLAMDNLPTTNSKSTVSWGQQPVEIGNHQWIVIQMPLSYLSNNWPIRYAAIDGDSRYIAVAGQNGFTHYSLMTRRWKLFGNESQEKDFEVRGGMLWWDDNIVVSCFNLMDVKYEIRVYSQKKKLDNQFAKIVEVAAEVHLMSIFKNNLLVLLLDGSFHLYNFHQKVSNSSSSSSLVISKLKRIVVNNLSVPPECATSIILSSLHTEPTVTHNNDSILINICGRLFLLEKKLSSSSEEESINNTNSSDDGVTESIAVYTAVSKLASRVENIWMSRKENSISDRPHLTNALWLSCGSSGMGVWLPLLLSENDKIFPQPKTHNFISKRIMLPINTHIYPLAVLFRDAVVLGAENDTIFVSKNCLINSPYCVISRTSQVYLHHILRGLLRQNLGIHAWEIANTCISLPYFSHSLELLLHEVLEEEATSSQSISDALLPRIIEFIREFPFFLQTVAHCARKTELALWPHLFSVVGDPRDLFQKCLDNNQLETAASYIIILQNLEKSSISRQHVLKLLDHAKSNSRWQLTKDLVRFLSVINLADCDNISTKTSPGLSTHTHLIKCKVSSLNSPPIASNESLTDATHLNHLAHQNQLSRKRTQNTSGININSNLLLHSPVSSTSMSNVSTNSTSSPNSPVHQSSLFECIPNGNVVRSDKDNDLNHNK